MESIRKRRLAKGLTQKELAEKADVTESQISQIETGKRKPSFETLLKISEALGCTTDDLVRDKKIPATESDGKEENEETIVLSKLTEKQQKLIRGILKLSDREASVLLSTTEAFLSDQ